MTNKKIEKEFTQIEEEIIELDIAITFMKEEMRGISSGSPSPFRTEELQGYMAMAENKLSDLTNETRKTYIKEEVMK